LEFAPTIETRHLTWPPRTSPTTSMPPTPNDLKQTPGTNTLDAKPTIDPEKTCQLKKRHDTETHVYQLNACTLHGTPHNMCTSMPTLIQDTHWHTHTHTHTHVRTYQHKNTHHITAKLPSTREKKKHKGWKECREGSSSHYTHTGGTPHDEAQEALS
jgi:hypothetical protein